ncbi:MAG: hypothetical protein ACREAE_05105 [Nitrosopumilaceae archaeon]
MQRLEERYDLLDALVDLSDENESPLQADLSDGSEYVEQMKYKPFELLDHLSAIKMGLDIIKVRTKGLIDKKTMEQFARIDGEILKMTDRLLELRQ